MYASLIHLAGMRFRIEFTKRETLMKNHDLTQIFHDLTPIFHLDTSLTLQAQVEQAWQMRKLLTDGAEAGLYDQSTKAVMLGARTYFRSQFALPPLSEVRQRVSAQNNNLSGDDLDRAVLTELGKLDRNFYTPEAQACFPEGTLVHTRDGLTPIEKIQIGDWVLSKPEDGTGEIGYKQVSQIFAHPPAMVVAVEYTFGERPRAWTPLDTTRPFILTTLNHPIWTMGDGWLEAGDLDSMRGKESVLMLANEEKVRFVGKHAIFRTHRENIGWISSAFQDLHSRGAEWDFARHELSATDIESPDGLEEYQYSIASPDRVVPDEVFQVPVFNIEVADWHTYFVGLDGVWVHNKNESKKIQVANGGSSLPEGVPALIGVRPRSSVNWGQTPFFRSVVLPTHALPSLAS